MAELPTGTVTFLFTDVEGSTRLLRELGDAYADVLADHRRTLRDAFTRHGGVEVDTQGDAFFVAFAKATDALKAAALGKEELASGPVKVRMGLHTGEPLMTDEGYVGIDVHRAARIAAAGHGGQILVSQSTRELAGSDSLRDLGKHRLKDLTAPERIYQLGDGDFPPLKSLNQTNLPVQLTPLVGRHRELADVVTLLRSSRLLTLTGAGGSGKTRLALHSAADVVDEFSDGVWFVPLAALTDPQLVSAMIASTLGVKDDDLVEFLRSKRLLLLLDNLEQLLPAAASAVADLLSAPNVMVLATSRERLAVAAEQEYVVPMLPLADAVALFTIRARQLKPGFEAEESVVDIARRLDGLPLAVELAAARVKVLTPQQIAQRLGHSLDLLTSGSRDMPQRQRTLRGTIEWSYELLDNVEQKLFARLAVFAGSFDVDSAERVCGARLDTLQSLVDKSLLRPTEEGRFFMLETIREYAEELLAEADDLMELSCAHAAYYLDVAESVRQRAQSGDQADAYAMFDADHNNFRRALTFFGDRDSVEEEFRLLESISGYWFLRGHWVEGNKHVASALRRADAAPPALRAEVLAIASDFARVLVGPELAMSYAEQSISAAREADDPAALSRALHELGESLQAHGDLERAKAVYREAIAIERKAGRSGVGTVVNLGDLALTEGDFDEAVARFSEALELWPTEGWGTGAAIPKFNLASALLHLERSEESQPLLNDALRNAVEVGHTEVIAWCLLGTAALLAKGGDSDDAARLLGACEVILEGVGLVLGASEQRLYDAVIATLDELQRTDLREDGRGMSGDVAIELALQYLH